MQVGDPVYTDRDYTVIFFPEMVKAATIIKTANADKTNTDTAYLSLELTGPSTVFVAYDSRLTQRPLWLSTWMDLGQDLRLSGHSSPFNLFAKSYPVGKAVLGGNTYGGSTYVVAMQPSSTPIPTPPPPDETLVPFKVNTSVPGVITISYPKPITGLSMTFDVRPKR